MDFLERQKLGGKAASKIVVYLERPVVFKRRFSLTVERTRHKGNTSVRL